MFLARVFASSRVWKPLVALCALCALAFTLGQGAAAVHLKLTESGIQSARGSAQQINLPVAGAHGTTPTPNTNSSAGRPASPVSWKSDPSSKASHESQMQPLTSGEKSKDKGKHQTKHVKAAGDKSHGGLVHAGGPKSGNTKGGQRDQQDPKGHSGQQDQSGGS